MSMECDTRLSMMALEQRAHRPAPVRRTNVRRYSATTVAAVAAFVLMLFTRTA